MTKTLLQNFDSFRRTDGTNSEPHFILQSSGIYANSFEIENINIPVTWYNINSTNNTMCWTDVGLNLTDTTITPGNYTASDLATEIGTQMTTDEVNGDTYTATYSTITQKFTIAGDGGNFEINWASNVSPTPWESNNSCANLAKLLGFYPNTDTRLGDENGVVTTTGAATYTGSSVAYINIRNVHVKSNLGNLANNYVSRTIIKKDHPTLSGGKLLDIGKNNILKVLPYDVIHGDIIKYRPFFPEIYTINNRSIITDIYFQLEDDFGNILDLNGQSWNMVVRFNLN